MSETSKEILSGVSRPEHRAIFEELVKQPAEELTDNIRGLLIIATPRCGSTLFCDVLNRTGKMGVCDEWLNMEYFRAYCDVVGATYDNFNFTKYLTDVITKSIRGTGIFVIKSHVGQLVDMGKRMGLQQMSFNKAIYLYRRDKIAQAVSYAKAQKTNQWRFDQTPDSSEFELTDGEISEALYKLVNTDEAYKKVYQQAAVAEYAYEDFQNLACPAYNEVLGMMGIQPLPTPFDTGVRRQRGQKSKDYAWSFKRYITGDH